jgi:Domain of unknown function (DUF5063)
VTEHRQKRDDLIAAASEFCELCENAKQLGSERFLLGLHRAQPRLQAAGAELPYPDDTDEIPDDDLDLSPTPEEMGVFMRPIWDMLSEIDWEPVWKDLHEAVSPRRFERRAQWPIRAFLYDDLYDTYWCLKYGLRLIDAGRPEAEAVFYWRMYFWSEWGYHNAEALRVIHYYVALYLAG